MRYLPFKLIVFLIVPFFCFSHLSSVRAPKFYHMTASTVSSPQFVWFRVAKVGTRSIYQALLNNNVSLDVDGSFVPFKPKEWKRAFKFAFVRNPWARVVSCYVDKVKSKCHRAFRECFDQDFEYFVHFIARQDLENIDRHIQLQTALIPLDEVDFIGRLENFEQDLTHVMSILGFTYSEVPHKHKTKHEHYSRYYTEETKAIIARKYKKDIELFDYTFEYEANN